MTSEWIWRLLAEITQFKDYLDLAYLNVKSLED